MKHSGPHRMWGSSIVTRIAAAVLGAVFVAPAANAQTDYYNTDAGRPLTIEDASATERYAFELQLAPLTLERTRGGVYRWEVEPEIAYGVLPRTQLEVGFPLSYLDRSGSRRLGLNGIDLGVLHNLNVETSIPALAIAADVLLPVGGFAPDEAVFTAKGIATRTLHFVRVHLNAQYSWGVGDTSELSRWLSGISVDRAFPLRSMLVGAEVFAQKSMDGGEDVQWNTAVGIRRQLSPTFNVDAGVGKQINGNNRSWFATFGLAHAFAVRSLLPRR